MISGAGHEREERIWVMAVEREGRESVSAGTELRYAIRQWL